MQLLCNFFVFLGVFLGTILFVILSLKVEFLVRHQDLTNGTLAMFVGALTAFSVAMTWNLFHGWSPTGVLEYLLYFAFFLLGFGLTVLMGVGVVKKDISTLVIPAWIASFFSMLHYMVWYTRTIG